MGSLRCPGIFDLLVWDPFITVVACSGESLKKEDSLVFTK